MSKIRRILVTGGAGYVGSVLILKLIKKGYDVRVLDLYLYGENLWPELSSTPQLQEIKGDIRDQALLRKALSGCDAVIHLACISNDPSFELNADLGRSINYDAFEPLVRLSKEAGVKRFIFASSASVYGISQMPEVTEEHPLSPLTDYSKYKRLCETILLNEQTDNFVATIIRPATVCGYGRRLRLDLTVNILTNHAVNTGKIKVFGGAQCRPSLHIHDMTDLYVLLLELPEEKVRGKIYNAGLQNHTVRELAEMVKKIVQMRIPEKRSIEIETIPTDDTRSYRISSEKIARELGFRPRHTIEDAVHELIDHYEAGDIHDPMHNVRYYNIKTMQNLALV